MVYTKEVHYAKQRALMFSTINGDTYELLPTHEFLEENSPQITIVALPSNVFIKVGNHLDPISLARACSVSRAWLAIYGTHPKWREFFLNNQYPYKHVAEGSNWRRLYSEPRFRVRAFGRNSWKVDEINYVKTDKFKPISVNGVDYVRFYYNRGYCFDARENNNILWNIDINYYISVEVNNFIGGLIDIKTYQTEFRNWGRTKTIPSSGDLYLWDSLQKTKPKKVVPSTRVFILLGKEAISITNGSLQVHTLESSETLYTAGNLKYVRWILPNRDDNLLYLMENTGDITTYSLTERKVISQTSSSILSSKVKKAISYGGAIFALEVGGDIRFIDPKNNINENFRYHQRGHNHIEISEGALICNCRWGHGLFWKVYPSETRTLTTFFKDTFRKK